MTDSSRNRNPSRSRSADELIADLTREVPAVRPLPSISRMTASVLVSALPASLILIALMGMREDLFSGATPPLFGSVLTSLVLIGIGGVVAAIAGAVPGRELLERIAMGTAGIGALVLLLGLGLARGQAGLAFDASEVGHSLTCTAYALMLSAPVVVWLSIVVRGAAPGRVARSAAAASIGGVATATLAVQLSCSSGSPCHLALGHFFAPLLAASLLAPLLVAVWRTLDEQSRARLSMP